MIRVALDPQQLRKTQMRLLEVGQSVATVLEEQGIPYSLSLGTLLGAVRHKGFIPWDDDFDLWIPTEVYADAICALRDHLPERYFVEDDTTEPLYFHSWAHVKDLYTEAYNNEYPQDGLYAHKGVSVDLYTVTRVRTSEFSEFINSENRKYIELRASKGVIDKDDYDRRMAALEDDIATGRWDIPGEDREVLGIITGYKHKWMRVEDFYPLARYEFEGRSFFGPHDADAVLTGFYGDYMTLPPAEKRISHYTSVKFLD